MMMNRSRELPPRVTESLDVLDRAAAIVVAETSRAVELSTGRLTELTRAALAGPLHEDTIGEFRDTAADVARAARGVESAAATVELVCLALLLVVAVGVAGDILLGVRSRG